MKRLIIIGAGGHGSVAAEAAEMQAAWHEIAFLDDDSSTTEILGYSVIGTLSDVHSHVGDGVEFLIAIGDNRQRLDIAEAVSRSGGALATIIHPSACVSPSAAVSPGTVVFAGAVINARTTIGSSSIVNTSATIDHDCAIDDGAHISPGANLAGCVSVGECSWVGIGASVRDGTRLGRNVVVGAGAAVVSDVPDNVTVVGVPARVQKSGE